MWLSDSIAMIKYLSWISQQSEADRRQPKKVSNKNVALTLFKMQIRKLKSFSQRHCLKTS